MRQLKENEVSHERTNAKKKPEKAEEQGVVHPARLRTLVTIVEATQDDEGSHRARTTDVR